MEDIIDAAQRGDARTIRDILDRDPTVISVQDDKGYSAHHWSAYADDGDVLEVLLQYDHKAPWTLLTKKGETVLHVASCNGSNRAVALLLKQGTHNTSAVNRFGETPLHLAAAANHTDTVQKLLAANADAGAQDQWGRTALVVAHQNGYSDCVGAIQQHGQEQNVDVGSATLAESSELSGGKHAAHAQLTADLVQHMKSHRLTRVEPTVKQVFQQASAEVLGNKRATPIKNLSTKKSLSKLVEYPGTIPLSNALHHGASANTAIGVAILSVCYPHRHRAAVCGGHVSL
eukprot:m.328975 g.328975  ORF g.328975 m.328975 type:complete len:288 (+) comp20439_c0_seq3:146-1009(+)